MKQYLQFFINHWILWSAFILIIITILFEEIRGRVQGVSRLQPQDLTRLINQEDATIIDVRDNSAFMRGHIIRAINIPHTQMNESLEKLKKYKDKPIVLVCANGQTSPQEGAKLRKNGFEKTYFLSGGISSWQGAGLPLTKD